MSASGVDPHFIISTLVVPATQRVECYRRNNLWDFELYQAGDCVMFKSIELSLNIAEVYEGVVFDAHGAV